MKLSLKLLALLVAISLCRQTSAAIFHPNDVASLITAINTSNTNMEDDTIELATNSTYTLTVINNDTNGLPVIGSDGGHKLVIHGNGATLQRSTAGGTPAFRIFQIDTGADVTIDRLTIMNGNQNVPGGEGGGIDNFHATLTITNSTLSSNSALLGGGIDNNHATLTITNSTLSGNSATAGGGINSDGEASGSATLTITNSTLSGNSATGGGGIDNFHATLTITNSTLSGNSATTGGGILNSGFDGDATLSIGGTVLNAGGSGANIFNNSGTVTSLGFNLSSDDGGGFLTGPGDQINTNPMLGLLQNNGGPTFTHALLVGSPAIDAGRPEFDQRGPEFNRVVNGRIDIGAFEVQPTPTPTITPRPTPTPRPEATPTPRP